MGYIGENSLKPLVKAILKIQNPVGTIRMSTSNENPESYLGFGTWQLWGEGKVPVGVDSSDTNFDTVEETGGTKSENYTPSGSNTGGTVQSHTLTIDQIPSHNHKVNDNSVWVQGEGYGHVNIGSVTGADRATIGWGQTQHAGGGKGHSHGFTQPTFNGTQATISHLQPYITCYMWKRVA